jgi:hypothetical protein
MRLVVPTLASLLALDSAAATAAAPGAALLSLELFAEHGEPDALCACVAAAFYVRPAVLCLPVGQLLSTRGSGVRGLGMDGTSSGIYFAAATTQPDYYVLYLQGGTQVAVSVLAICMACSHLVGAGGWCNDKQSCDSRCGTRGGTGHCSGSLASSSVWAKTQSEAGLFSTSASKSPLPGANKAFLRYCTGDAHMGNRDASAGSFNFNFHGSRTVRAALSLLVSKHGLGAQPGQTLLFGGGSAGGRGVMANLDFVPGLLRAMMTADGTAVHPPRVLGFPDSPYWIDLVPDRASGDKFIGFAQQTREIFALANISGRASARCASAYTSEPWKCALGVYRMPYVTTPYLMVASQADAFQMGEDIGHMPTTPQVSSLLRHVHSYSCVHAHRTARGAPPLHLLGRGGCRPLGTATQ